MVKVNLNLLLIACLLGTNFKSVLANENNSSNSPAAVPSAIEEPNVDVNKSVSLNLNNTDSNTKSKTQADETEETEGEEESEEEIEEDTGFKPPSKEDRYVQPEASSYNEQPQPKPTGPEKVIVGYYADWKANELAPENIPYNKLTHINYSFAIVKENYEPYFESEYLLPKVVKMAHDNKVKVLLSVGGWTGSKHFSVLASDPEKRKVFIQKLVDYVKKFDLDGIDIDWEFPGKVGMSCNVVNPAADAANFITLLRELRGSFNGNFPSPDPNMRKLITLAVRVEPIDGPSGPIQDTTELADQIDFVNVMAYDINGPWSSTTGPNAPLRHHSGKGFQYSYMSGVQAWLGAKFPKDKLVMGLAFYGRSFQLESSTKLEVQGSIKGDQLYVPFVKMTPQGDSQDGIWADPCPGAPSTYSGVWQWKNLRSQNLLKTPITSNPSDGWTRIYDETSHTPWLYNSKTSILISYDDPVSLNHKVQLAKCQGLRGVMAWALHEDNSELLDSIQDIRNPKIKTESCSNYNRIDEEQNKIIKTNRSMVIDMKPFAKGTFGLMYSVNRHPPSSYGKMMDLPDKIFSA